MVRLNKGAIKFGAVGAQRSTDISAGLGQWLEPGAKSTSLPHRKSKGDIYAR